MNSFENYSLQYCLFTINMSIQGEDVNDTANILLPGLPGPLKDKRRIEQVLGCVEMCAPTNKHMNWVTLKMFKIMCCVNEFSAKSKCTLAYCLGCFEKREEVW